MHDSFIPRRRQALGAGPPNSLNPQLQVVYNNNNTQSIYKHGYIHTCTKTIAVSYPQRLGPLALIAQSRVEGRHWGH